MKQGPEGSTENRDFKITGAEMIVLALKENGDPHVFGYPGGVLLPFLEALEKREKEQGPDGKSLFTLARHEQGAAFAAGAYGKTLDKVGCSAVTSGPGATNAVTAIADAHADGTRLVVLSAQVATTAPENTQPFQKCEITDMVRTCTKAAYKVQSVEELPDILHKAFVLAREGKPGPVLIDIPVDVQNAVGTYIPLKEWEKTRRPHIAITYDGSEFTKAVQALCQAKRPVVVAGGGVINSGASPELIKFVDKMGFPVVTTLMGIGAVRRTDPRYLGMIGSYGQLVANEAVREADLVFVLGARINDRVAASDRFASGARFVHIDLCPQARLGNEHEAISVRGDCREVMAEITKQCSCSGSLDKWWGEIKRWRSLVPADSPDPSGHVLLHQAVREACEAARDHAGVERLYITTDVGQNQIAAAHAADVLPGHFITSGGFGTMGFGLPAAIGVKTAKPDAFVLCVAGDGSFLMNVQEMATARQNNLDIKVIIMDNRELGMIQEVKNAAFKGGDRYSDLGSWPHYPHLAMAFGWKWRTCSSPTKMKEIMQLFMETTGPALLDCRVKGQDVVGLSTFAKRGIDVREHAKVLAM